MSSKARSWGVLTGLLLAAFAAGAARGEAALRTPGLAGGAGTATRLKGDRIAAAPITVENTGVRLRQVLVFPEWTYWFAVHNPHGYEVQCEVWIRPLLSNGGRGTLHYERLRLEPRGRGRITLIAENPAAGNPAGGVESFAWRTRSRLGTHSGRCAVSDKILRAR